VRMYSWMTSGKDEFREIMGNPGRFFHPAREKVCRDRERMRPGGRIARVCRDGDGDFVGRIRFIKQGSV